MSQAANLWQEYRATRSQALRNQLVESQLPLLRAIAYKLHQRLPPGSIDLDDLVSAGSFGLVKSVELFDPDRGIRFATFASLRIRGAMLDEIRELDWIPRLIRVQAKQLDEAIAQLTEQLGRSPEESELMEALGLEQPAFRELLKATRAVKVTSYDRQFEFEDFSRTLSPLESLANEDSPADRLERQELVQRVFKGLSKVERMLLIGYYFEEMTMKQIGKQLDLSESRVSQMLAKLLMYLRQTVNRQAPELLSA